MEEREWIRTARELLLPRLMRAARSRCELLQRLPSAWVLNETDRQISRRSLIEWLAAAHSKWLVRSGFLFEWKKSE